MVSKIYIPPPPYASFKLELPLKKSSFVLVSSLNTSPILSVCHHDYHVNCNYAAVRS